MNIINTILKVDSTADINSIVRCIEKSNILIFIDGIYLVADDTHIYYFGALEESRTPSKLGRFLKSYKDTVKGKLLYSKDITPFKRYTKVVNKEKGLYRWQ